MSNQIERRSFLKYATGASLLALNFLYPGISKVAVALTGTTTFSPNQSGTTPRENVRFMKGPDPSYAGGEVVSKTSDGIILQSKTGVRAVRLSPDTIIWKEFDVTAKEIELGDWVDVKGKSLLDGTLQAISGWAFVNIGRQDGVIKEVSPRSLTLENKRGIRSIELSSKLEVISARHGSSLPGQIEDLSPGAEVGAVGLRLPDGGFRATRIWLH